MLASSQRSLKDELEVTEAVEAFGYNDSTSRDRATTVAKNILAGVMQFRRMASGAKVSCTDNFCAHCMAPHLEKVVSAVERGIPVTFVLPAFPGKSPNAAKVLGPLPDMAERRALEFLQHLCEQIGEIYAPGARMILCSDGRVFSDAVGLDEENVTAYQQEISRMIVDLGLTAISTFNLDDLYAGLSFDGMRVQLMKQYGEPLDALKEEVSRGGKGSTNPDDIESHRLYCGMTRFLLEDSAFPGQTKSRTALQKECRVRAYDVMQKSKAWGGLVAEQFPEAVRLSIHPQACGSQKLGIRLIEPDNWMTPWHGVAVDMGGSFILLKRAHAEELGARLIYLNGRPSHFVLAPGSEGAKKFFESNSHAA